MIIWWTIANQCQVLCSQAGGTHHAFAGSGEGFCAFNDIAVAVRAAQAEYGVTSFLVIDLDVHQGNGTADIFETDEQVVTFDMHGAPKAVILLHMTGRELLSQTSLGAGTDLQSRHVVWGTCR